MTEEERSHQVTLRDGDVLPADDLLIELVESRRGRATLRITAPRSVPIGTIRRAGRQQGGES